MENIELEYLTNVSEMYTPTILYVANMPETPTGLSASQSLDGTYFFLNWDPNTEPDIEGYTVYYGTLSGVYDSTKSVSAAGDTLWNMVPGTTFYIALSASDVDGYESLLTEELEFENTPLLSPPEGLASTSLEDVIELGWQEYAGGVEIEGYNVYSSLYQVPTDTTLLGFVEYPITTYTDSTAEAHLIYSYYVTAIDTQVPPNESGPSEEALGRRATHDMGILVVDNTKDGSGEPLSPTDEEVDEYYAAILEDYNLQAFWDVDDSLGVDRSVMDYDIGIYSTVLWNSDVSDGQPMDSDTTTMRKYLEGGGNLWITGWNLLTALTGESGPDFIFEEGEFLNQFVGVDSAKMSSSADTDFIGARGLVAEFPSVSIDMSKVPAGGLFSMDILLSPFEGTRPAYSYVSSDSSGSQYHGQPNAVISDSENYGLVFTDFPLFFIEGAGAGLVVEAVMELFGEEVSVEVEDGLKMPLSYSLSQNYPNPFNPMTTIYFEIPTQKESENSEAAFKTAINIYDTRGRLVKELLREDLSSGRYQVTWDGKNREGASVSSGIYFYRITSGSYGGWEPVLAKLRCQTLDLNVEVTTFVQVSTD
jgi:hypothetical protein